MISSREFIRQSLELHLFFARIMKEHSFFLELAFTPRDKNFGQQADTFRKAFDKFLWDVLSISNGIVSQDFLDSKVIVTPYTLAAEVASANFTGVKIPLKLTQIEENLVGGNLDNISTNQMLEQKVFILNRRAILLISNLIQFKSSVLANVLACKMFTTNYPSLIEHIIHEAEMYMKMVQSLQNRQVYHMEQEELEHVAFWNHILADHAKFMRGSFDPSEEELFETANNFANEFDLLTEDAKSSKQVSDAQDRVTEESFNATEEMIEFNRQGIKGILECKVKSIIIPLLADHTLREANYYLRLLMIMSRE